MKVSFGQVYIQAGVEFPFSHHFQLRLASEIAPLVQPSPKFIKQYGRDHRLIFRISAKKGLTENEIKGPTVFKDTKDVEFTVFLPFDTIIAHADAPKRALRFLLKGVCDVLDRLGIDKAGVQGHEHLVIEDICSDAKMLTEPSWDETRNKAGARTIFQEFYDNRLRE